MYSVNRLSFDQKMITLDLNCFDIYLQTLLVLVRFLYKLIREEESIHRRCFPLMLTSRLLFPKINAKNKKIIAS